MVSGLASSDETGRTDPNVSRYFDAPYMSWNAQGDPNLGAPYTDRPHQGKIQATYDFTFGTTVGLNAVFQSGLFRVRRRVDTARRQTNTVAALRWRRQP